MMSSNAVVCDGTVGDCNTRDLHSNGKSSVIICNVAVMAGVALQLVAL
jgi:hypothetical protein